MTTVMELALECPRCGGAFVTNAVMSCGNAGQDTDFRPHYWGTNPLPHFLHRCPLCRFVGSQEDFELHEGSTEGLPVDEAGPGAGRYADAAGLAEREGESLKTVADLYLRAGWCARVAGDEEAEQRNMGRAAAAFSRALEIGEVRQSDAAVITYLVAELHRRCGRFGDATAWFEQAASVPADEERAHWLPALLERQRRLA